MCLLEHGRVNTFRRHKLRAILNDRVLKKLDFNRRLMYNIERDSL